MVRKKRALLLFHFSECYEQQNFYEEQEHIWLDFQNLPGTNCYLDEEAGEVLREKIAGLPLEGVHFLDSGNYHYLSCLWMERIQEPFALLMLDHHTDLQPPAFGGLLSCGGWLRELLEKNPFLQEVWLIGPPEKDFLENGTDLAERIRFLSEEQLVQENSMEEFLKKISLELPLYISIDKDVLREEEAPCNWDQGCLGFERLLRNLTKLLERFRSERGRILGIDICGEADRSCEADAHKKNDEVNRRLLETILGDVKVRDKRV